MAKDKGGDVVKLEKTYAVRLTEKEMAAVASCITAYFNRLTFAKQAVPPAVAGHVTQALYKMREAAQKNGIVMVQQ